MKISLNPKTFNIKQTPVFKASNPFREIGSCFAKLNRDVFQKTEDIVFSPIKKPVEIPNEIVELYDETYKEVMKQNPIVKELNYKKPELMYENSMDEAYASYDIICNTVRISSHVKENLYVAYLKNKNEISYILSGVMDETSMKESSEKLKAKNPDVIIEKLNDEEKRLYIKSVIAHELRHSIQEHLVLSTEGCAQEYKNFCAQLAKEERTLTKEYIKLAKEAYLRTKNSTKYNISNALRDLKNSNYVENYVPKKLLPSNTSLKFSRSKTDTREISVKNHLLKSGLNHLEYKSNPDYYFSDPAEIDAHNYQTEYLYNKRNENCRKEIMDVICIRFLTKTTNGIKKMNEFGFPPFSKQ